MRSPRSTRAGYGSGLQPSNPRPASTPRPRGLGWYGTRLQRSRKYTPNPETRLRNPNRRLTTETKERLPLTLGTLSLCLLTLAVAGPASARPIKPAPHKKPAAAAPRHAAKPSSKSAKPSSRSPTNPGHKANSSREFATRKPTRGRSPRSTYAPITVALESRGSLVARITQSLASPRAGLEDPAALHPFFDKLRALETNPQSGVVRILQFGDSHTASDTFTGPMRTLFQTKFGDGGAGYSYPGYPFAGYKIHGTHRSQSPGWFVTGTHFRDLGDDLLGMGGVSLSAQRPGASIALDADAVSLEVQYLVQPGGGDLAVYDGDQLLQSVSTDGPSTTAGHFDTDVPPGPHHFEVRTTTSLPVRLFGLRTEQAAGVTYESMGLNGAEAGLLLQYNEPLAQTLMDQRDASLIVLAYGTNEASDSNWTEEGYASMFRRLIARMRRLAPNASILVLGPADRELRTGTRRRVSWNAYSGIDRIVRAQRLVCREQGCAYWDTRARMGGFGAMREWVQAGWGQPDHTHFTGEGYTELAAALFADLIHEYNSYGETQ